jgi:hypothetical protein
MVSVFDGYDVKRSPGSVARRGVSVDEPEIYDVS